MQAPYFVSCNTTDDDAARLDDRARNSCRVTKESIPCSADLFWNQCGFCRRSTRDTLSELTRDGSKGHWSLGQLRSLREILHSATIGHG